MSDRLSRFRGIFQERSTRDSATVCPYKPHGIPMKSPHHIAAVGFNEMDPYAVLDEQMAGQVVGRPGIGQLALSLGEGDPGQRRPSKIDLRG